MTSARRPRRHGRSQDGIRQEYYDGELRAAREAAERAAQDENRTEEQP
jgi:hypothetical protein